jgi:hypothetical protein
MLRTTQRTAERLARPGHVFLFHATPRGNHTSILCRGLLTALSQGALKAVWLCEPGRRHWACMHSVRRHGGRIEDVIVVKVEVPRDWLKAHGGHTGLWRCTRDIPPQCFKRIDGFAELSASPVGGRAGR